MNRRATLRAPLAVRAGVGGGGAGEEWVGWRGAGGKEMAHGKRTRAKIGERERDGWGGEQSVPA